MSAPAPVGTLRSIGAELPAPDADAAAALRELPAVRGDALGRLGDLAEWLAGVQGCCPPRALTRPRCIEFRVDSGAGADPARPAPVDPAAGVLELVRVGPRSVGIAPGGAADLTSAEVLSAVALGAAAADEEIDAGADLLVVAVPDASTDSPAMVVVSVMTNTEPVKVLTRGARAAAPDAWMAQAEFVRDRRRQAFDLRSEPNALLTVVGSLELAAAAGFVLQASARKTGVILDGLGAIAAALVAYEAAPPAVRWWLAADRAPGPAHDLALTKLGLHPALDLSLARGDGTAGALTVGLLRAAVAAVGPAPGVE